MTGKIKYEAAANNSANNSQQQSVQKNLLQQYNNYIQIKPGNSRTAGHSLNLTQKSLQGISGQIPDGFKMTMPGLMGMGGDFDLSDNPHSSGIIHNN